MCANHKVPPGSADLWGGWRLCVDCQALGVQKYCRAYLVRNLYQLIRVATITIQAYTRGFLARRRYQKV